MDIQINQQLPFPMASLNLGQGETCMIAHGSMIYRTAGVELNAQLNAQGSGLGKLVKAVGRSITSGESMFITQVVCNAPGGLVAIAPNLPGQIVQLDVGAHQYRLNDRVFLAMDSTVNYQMQRQSVGRAFLGGTGGFFVMSTQGQGRVLVNAYGSVVELNLDNAQGFAIDNGHVVAWEQSLNYEIQLQSGLFGSIGTGEGVVNIFNGSGKVLIQTLNIESLARAIAPYVAARN
ncbi:MAG: TIGR00266 family protein [Coriobacteriales bacterium]|jgi:uncharacterized protein (TIGR00266 family)|nr:TIGR00266 family protein [Coriobacteriales bacterium]